MPKANELDPSAKDKLLSRITSREAVVGVIGQGYVGLPLALVFAKAGFKVVGFDVDPAKIETLNRGDSYIRHVGAARVAKTVGSGCFEATADFTRLADCDAILICVPTPLGVHREPDMSFVYDTASTISKHLRLGQLVVLESTTYPGTTDEELTTILEESGLGTPADFFLAFSPEREDPDNPSFSTASIPKLVGAVNMDIGIWEIIEAAETKPFGFQVFYPGPGLGGHCILLNPFYLGWKAAEYGVWTRFIELAGEINTRMPEYVVSRLEKALAEEGTPLKDAKILVLGLSYKPDIDDDRESPSYESIRLLQERGAAVAYCDPHIPATHPTRKHDLDLLSVDVSAEEFGQYDALQPSTPHEVFRDPALHAKTRLLSDTRNAVRTPEGYRYARA